MLTPAQRHFQKVMAERRGQADEESDIQRTAHEQILHRLRMDLSRLSGVQSEETKAEMKNPCCLNMRDGLKARSTATTDGRMKSLPG